MPPVDAEFVQLQAQELQEATSHRRLQGTTEVSSEAEKAESMSHQSRRLAQNPWYIPHPTGHRLCRELERFQSIGVFPACMFRSGCSSLSTNSIVDLDQ